MTHIVQEAYQIASQYGLAAMDALHVAAALSVGAEELVTTEKRTKPMHQVTSINVVSIFD
ncbi:PIN domain-containing protein [Nostoc sp. UHCC 0926]|uniref:PIN domain-containing protein n=1 Tax=unclassified Nostoc TaxID=2593658 RepID=UPI00236136DC|nr:PIN domain-containing protein [Nostoc sp. UHCC 0926]WDD32113.1 PIN domain-containing protein [Nostoc sp. UHCC 0926]